MIHDDFYCNEVLSKRTPVKIVEETARVLAFEHTQPYWETHIVIVPKEHIRSLCSIGAKEQELLAEMMAVAIRVCNQVEDKCGGCRLRAGE